MPTPLPKSTPTSSSLTCGWILRRFAHKSVNHTQTYVAPGNVHTNGVENVWSLFKRGIMGIFHKVSEKYLPLYLDEFAFRFNNRDEFNLMDKVLSECF